MLVFGISPAYSLVPELKPVCLRSQNIVIINGNLKLDTCMAPSSFGKEVVVQPK